MWGSARRKSQCVVGKARTHGMLWEGDLLPLQDLSGQVTPPPTNTHAPVRLVLEFQGLAV